MNKKIDEAIKEQVYKATDNEYILSFGDLSINLFTQSITITDLVFQPSKKQDSAKTKYIFKAKKMKIINFSIISYVKKHDLLIDKIEFEAPLISILQGTEKALIKKNKTSSHNDLSKKLNSILIDHIDTKNIEFSIYEKEIKPIFYSKENHIDIQNLKVKLKSDPGSLFVFDKFEIVINNFNYDVGKEGLYTLYGKKLYASYNDSALIIDSLKLLPNFDKKEFSKKAGRQTSRTEFMASVVNVEKINYKLFYEDHKLVAHKIEFTGCNIDVFRDNSYPLAPIHRRSLQAIVKNLPFHVLVDTIEMKNGILKFEALTPESLSTGTMSVTKMNITITGVQNDTTLYSDNPSIKTTVNGYILDQGKFTETCTFPLKYTEEFFYCTGSMSSMPMSSFNPMLKHTKYLSISTGQLDTANFSFVAHENSSTGTMEFKYHDLKVDLLNGHADKKGLIVVFKSLLANSFLIKESNPGENGIVRVSNIYVKHNPYRYFLNYSMQSILSGIEPAIIDKNTPKWMQNK